MVIYDLACHLGHRFEGWFQDHAAYREQAASGQLLCPTCGSTSVEKQVSGSAIRRSQEDRAGTVEAPPPSPPSPAPGSPSDKVTLSPGQAREFLGTLAAHLRAHSEDVGPQFAQEARAIHRGEAQARSIRGTASEEEETSLREDEIPFLKLPFPPTDD
jgi:hypothetical protein